MAINNWWSGDSRERFWIEITNRDNIGTNLIAPQVNDAGREEWSYTLVNWVRPGDVVLHWSKLGEPAIVGYSHVSEEPFASSLEWQSRGTYGRQREGVGKEEAWEALLIGYRQLAVPVTQSRMRELEPEVRRVRDELQADHSGAIYFPFALSDLRPVRAAQAYLSKFPAALVRAIPELQEVRQVAADEPGEGTSEVPKPRNRRDRGRPTGHGRQHDVARRKAVERYSVDLVIEHLEGLGYVVKDVGDSKSWDVSAVRGLEEMHVEVKGSTVERLAVALTEGEVRHAEDNGHTLLVVIDKISMAADLSCSGGRWRFWQEWIPARGELIPTAYRHPLTTGVSGQPAL